MKRAFALLLLATSTQAFAANTGKLYFSLKDDKDLFVGEGVVEQKEFEDNGLKALEAARERARAALASSIQVRITSETTEELKNGKDGSSEEISSKSKSLSDLVLENVHSEDFVDFPEKGKITVLAYVTKEDYRRQLAGKSVRVYRPQYGLKLAVWGWVFNPFLPIEDTGTVNGIPGDAKLRNNASGGGGGGGGGEGGNGSGMTAGYGLEFVWKDYSFGLDYYRKDTQLYIYDPKANVYDVNGDGLGYFMASAGWQWIPWNWRVQPYFPVGVHVAQSSWYMYNAGSAAVSLGAGLRYWPSDSFSFEVGFRHMQSIWANPYLKEGEPLRIRTDRNATFDLTGSQVRVAMQWSGY